jgi:ribonucleoside-diphosphate reductase alpha chain
MSIVNKPAAVKTNNKKGLTIERIYTTAGVHPYDSVKWERRDVVQTNWKSGEVIFEQKSVEYPDFWSVNASTIVTTKYFRGALGAENREYSLKQVIDRVVLTYTKAGKDNGYFASDEDAQVFEHELTYMLMNQIFSYNSPVWFNVGTNALHNKYLLVLFSQLMTRWNLFLIGIKKRALSSKVDQELVLIFQEFAHLKSF